MATTTLLVPSVPAALALAGAAAAGDVTLTIGDPAPPLEVAHWLKGEEVGVFAADRIYVLEFWATWCGPCVAGMPHVSELQEKYADRGVTVIGVSDEPPDTVTRFLASTFKADGKRQDERARYAIATDPDQSAQRAYLAAAGESGLPTVFIVGREGLVEWIGHPVAMADPLARIVDRTWDRAAFKAERQERQRRQAAFDRASTRLQEAILHEDWEAAITALDAIIDMGRDTYAPTKLAILLSRVQDYDRGYAYARKLVNDAWDEDPWILMQVAWVVSGVDTFPIDEKHRDWDLALRAMTRSNELTEWQEWGDLEMLAGIEARMDRHADAAKHQRMALDRLRALEDRIEEHEMDSYRRKLAELAETLAEYERRTR